MHGLRKEKVEKLKELHSKGLNDRQIAEKIGCSAVTVSIQRRYKLHLGANPHDKYAVSSFRPFFSDVEVGYISGILDGEGAIMLHKYKWKGGVNIYPQIQIANTSQELIKWLRGSMNIGKIKVKRQRSHYKPLYILYIFKQKDIEQFLEFILPFLRVKRDLAKKVLEFCKLRLSKPRGVKTHSPKEEKLYEEVKRLQCRNLENQRAKEGGENLTPEEEEEEGTEGEEGGEEGEEE